MSKLFLQMCNTATVKIVWHYDNCSLHYCLFFFFLTSSIMLMYHHSNQRHSGRYTVREWVISAFLHIFAQTAWLHLFHNYSTIISSMKVKLAKYMNLIIITLAICIISMLTALDREWFIAVCDTFELCWMNIVNKLFIFQISLQCTLVLIYIYPTPRSSKHILVNVLLDHSCSFTIATDSSLWQDVYTCLLDCWCQVSHDQ